MTNLHDELRAAITARDLSRLGRVVDHYRARGARYDDILQWPGLVRGDG